MDLNSVYLISLNLPLQQTYRKLDYMEMQRTNLKSSYNLLDSLSLLCDIN